MQAAPCGAVPVGHAVYLKSGELDPDVFVWDTKQRVIDYAGGSLLPVGVIRVGSKANP